VTDNTIQQFTERCKGHKATFQPLSHRVCVCVCVCVWYAVCCCFVPTACVPDLVPFPTRDHACLCQHACVCVCVCVSRHFPSFHRVLWGDPLTPAAYPPPFPETQSQEERGGCVCLVLPASAWFCLLSAPGLHLSCGPKFAGFPYPGSAPQLSPETLAYFV